MVSMEDLPSGCKAQINPSNEWQESQVHFNLPQSMMKGDARQDDYSDKEVQVNLPDDCSSHKSDKDDAVMHKEENLEHMENRVDAEFGQIEN